MTAGVQPAASHALYDRLMALLDEHGATFQVIDHAPEGQTGAVSRMRGHAVSSAAKCLILMVKHGKKRKRFVLAVVPGDRQVDFGAVRHLLDASWVGFAPQATAEELAGSPVGTVLPFAFEPDLELICDPDVLTGDHIFFNAARLDRSLALATADWQRLAQPRVAGIASPAPAHQETAATTSP